MNIVFKWIYVTGFVPPYISLAWAAKVPGLSNFWDTFNADMSDFVSFVISLLCFPDAAVLLSASGDQMGLFRK